MQISAYQDMDSAELLTSICCEHLKLGFSRNLGVAEN